jgi:3'(2'), 5'-bisphosphate nucleotidase
MAARRASSALKYGLLAEGEAHVHLRHGPTMTWDICAGDAILTAAGGAVRDHEGRALNYRTAARGHRNPPLVAVSDIGLLPDALAAVAQRES